MAGPRGYTAILDACVLYPAVVRDALMSLHVAGFFAAKWTPDIENEWLRNLLANRRDLREDQLRETCSRMHEAVPDWEVENYQPLIDCLDLPDVADRHVLAAAIRGHADCIVTANINDFPREYVGQFDVEVLHPDDFIVLQLELNEVSALKAFKAMRQRLVRPPLTPERFVENFVRHELVRTAARLRDGLELL